MTTDFTAAAIPDAVQVLSQAAKSYRARIAPAESNGQIDRPSPEQVVQALLQAERFAKQQRLQYSFADLVGEWRLCFTVNMKKRGVKKRASRSEVAREQPSEQPGEQIGGIRLTRGFYLPLWMPAQIGFFAAPEAAISGFGSGTITNQVQFGSVRLRFTGPARYLGKKNLLAFDFTQIAVDGFGKTLFQTGFRGGQAKAAQFEQMPIAKLPFFAFFSVTPDWIAARGRGGGLALWIRAVPDRGSNHG